MAKTMLAAYESIQNLNGRELVRLICEATINGAGPNARQPPPLTSQGEPNPFFEVMAQENFYYPIVSSTHRDLAEIFLTQIVEPRKYSLARIPALNSSELEYLRLSEYIAMWTGHPESDQLPTELFHSPDINQIMASFFSFNQNCFDQAIGQACRLVYYGIPLFELGEDGVANPLPFSDENHVYISKKSEYKETAAESGAEGRYPKWAMRYAIKVSDLAGMKDFFRHDGEDAVPSTVAKLRIEYRRSLGFDSQGADLEEPPSRHHFPLLKFVRKLLNRDCSELFDDDIKVWPKQSAILDWLQKKNELSARAALAIAIILTPSK